MFHYTFMSEFMLQYTIFMRELTPQYATFMRESAFRRGVRRSRKVVGETGRARREDTAIVCIGKKMAAFSGSLVYSDTGQEYRACVRRGSYFYFRTPPLRSAVGQSVMPGSTADQSVMPSSAARFASAAQMRSMPSKLFARSANTP